LKIFKGFLIPGLLLIIWYFGASLEFWNSYIVPSPVKTLQTGQQLVVQGILYKHISVSLFRVFTGFGLAFVIAFLLGILLGMNKKLIDYFEPILEFIRHIPPLATVPMLILWFGIGETSKLIVIVLASFFPIFLNTLSGVLNCDYKLLEVGKSFGFNGWEKFKKIILPSMLPYVLVGMQLGPGYSWRSLIGAELIAAASGLGYMILDAEQLSRPDIIIVGVLTIGILGSVIDFMFFQLASYCTPWKTFKKEQEGW
jgi:sulfonate transport system permease protein